LNFYAKNGFVVIPRSDDEVFDTVARISKEVQP
jgi:hypothetical protein